MELIKKILVKTQDIETTIKASAIIGAIWIVLAMIVGLISQLQLFLDLQLPMGYGITRPIFTNMLIFGGLLSIFLSIAYYLVAQRVEGDFKLATIAVVALKLQQLAVILGVVGICLGYNNGREYGEFNFIAQNLMILGLIHSIVVILINLNQSNKNDIVSSYITATLGGMLAVYIIGNMGLPFSPYASVSFFTGMQDQTIQEIYRLGILSFFILMPAMTLLTAFVPEYFKVPLYSQSMARFSILATILVLPLAASSWLVGTSAPSLLQTLGMFSGIAFNIAVIIGILNIHYTITKSGKTFKSDGISMLLRVGGVFIMILAIIRIIGMPSFIQDYISYSYLNTRDIAFDAQTYALLIIFGGLFFVFQKMNNSTLSDKVLKILFIVGGIGIALMLTANITQGFYQGAVALQLGEKGKLVHVAWSKVLVAGPFTPDSITKVADLTSSYLLSLRAIFLIGYIILFASVLLTAFSFLLGILKGGKEDYQQPELNQAGS